MDNASGLIQQRYEIQRQLGKNAGRQTLLAYDQQENQQVVIKLLTFDLDFEWDDLKLFEREAETLKALSHPNIPRYLDFFEIDLPDSKQLALIQGYVEGQSLDSYLKSGRIFTEFEIKQLVKSLLNILKYLHGRKPPVIHRDIKPSNIILGDRTGNSIGEVYLVDFGSVQTLATQEGRTVTVVGTYGYMPPEQFGGRAVPASDLYGVGATTIALLTGKHPADLPQQDLRIQFEHAAHFPPMAGLVKWLTQMTEPDLKLRLSSTQAALEALEYAEFNTYKPAPVQPLPTPTFTIVGVAIAQNMGTSCLSGAFFCGLIGTSVFPVLGTLVGAGIGLAVGLTLGLVNGIFLGLVTRLGFYPLTDARLHRQVVANISTVLVSSIGAVLLLIALAIVESENGIDPVRTKLFVLFLGVPIVVIAGLAARLSGRSFAQ
ncbi:protein kinase [Oculatella sp. FACHB-28]|uniref:serine/threonine protein kinase n=1 Tax=Oculatella sp. FACHB-28 TaxID=2692845 RepID=UPI001682BB63|nr:serine/threonine-protein kinase [Oculatella sp. FACHB-28]MBD2058428.1 protein kinase [Oculatella sp. FACHB-28]